MERYKIIKEVGDGTFGSVWRAINMQTSEVVAIKKIKKKIYTWEECVALIEVKSLSKMNHPNIVKLKEVIRENDILYFVFEYMDCNLYQMMLDRGKKLMSEAEVRNWCFQVFQGLAYMHQRRYFHRDLKPENLLITKDILKIADFGLAREIGSEPPYTEYVSTRWYRAPENLLRSSVYGPSVDMWAIGAIMAELFTLCPLFPGSSEADQVEKICNVIGSPTKDSWAEGLYLAKSINYQFPQFPAVNLSALLPSASDDAISLIQSICSWDPSKRPTALEALQHPFFQSCFYVPPSLRSKVTVSKTSPLGVQRKLEMNKLDDDKYEMHVKRSVKATKYQMHSKINQISEAGEKLANMTIGCRRKSSRPPISSTWGWHGHSENAKINQPLNPARGWHGQSEMPVIPLEPPLVACRDHSDIPILPLMSPLKAGGRWHGLPS